MRGRDETGFGLALFVGLSAAAAIGFGVQWALSTVVPVGGTPALFSRFNALHFEINYLEHGLVRRGLIGTLFQAVPDGARDASILIFSLATILALAAVLSVTLARAPRPDANTARGGLAALWIAAPVAFINFGYDFARLDQVNFLCLAAGLYALRRGYAIAAALPGIVALLVHEAYLFYGLPLIVGYALVGSHTANRCRAVIAAVASSAVTVVVLGACGRFEPGRDVLVERLGDRLRPGSENALAIWQRTVDDNLGYVGDRLADGLFAPATLAVFAATVVLTLAWLIGLYRRHDRALDPLALAPLGVLVLFVFGVDYARWVALIALSAMTIVTLHVLDGRFTAIAPRLSRATCGGLMAAAAVLGPFGTVQAFPIYSRFVLDLF